MKKKYKIEVDCANCAAKVEEALRKIEGIQEANVNFLTQKVVLDLDETREKEIIEEAQRRCRKVDADCRILV